jgi:hypothetical protein
MAASYQLMKQLIQFSSGTMPLAALVGAAETAMNMVSNGTTSDLTEESARQEREMRLAERQVELDLKRALVDRIRTSEIVVTKEDSAWGGDGKVGVAADAKSQALFIGLEAGAQRVIRREYLFQGSLQSSAVDAAGAVNKGH